MSSSFVCCGDDAVEEVKYHTRKADKGDRVKATLRKMACEWLEDTSGLERLTKATG